MSLILGYLRQNSDHQRSIAYRMFHTLSLFGILLSLFPLTASTKDKASYVLTSSVQGAFTLSTAGTAAPLVGSSSDYPGVLRVLRELRTDIGRVTGVTPSVSLDTLPTAHEVVIAGTLGKSPLIDRLVREGKVDTAGVPGRWETSLTQVVEKPFPGVDRALVIAGSDKRGSIYGMYDLSAKIGVSPWNWWADVPVRHQPGLFVALGRYVQGEPAVKYRGIFINDEAPALSGWAREKFGGLNHQFYEKVFDLILRLKGNFLWPAMWDNAFAVDDTSNPRTADEYGVVMSTSHHEPMMRAQKEWARFGSGPWNYEKNDSVLREFWRGGIRRMNSHESIVTIGMRGDGDEPMLPQANISLLERIVRDQRQILREVTGKDPATIPQVWALYKEVQEYYDEGMRVPDDVTLLLSDDNWGNLRKLPNLTDRPRAGGYGIYYHFDYVGAPRNYKWLNTNQIARVWEQMHLAYAYGARQIWLVNVGDIKPMEYPISFFLDYAWDPTQWPAERLPEYARLWAEQQFGPDHAAEIGEMLTDYTTYNARRKPELLSPGTYSLVNYHEAATVVADYNALAEKAQRLYNSLPAEYKDAFYELVLHPITACANLNELYVTVGKNRLYAAQGRAVTDSLAAYARQLYARDSAITHYYNTVLADGKWNHMMDQTHIGYTYWQQPDNNTIPEVKEITVPADAEMGVAIEGSTDWWPQQKGEAVLPPLGPFNPQRRYVDIFNRGKAPFEYTVYSNKPWLHVTAPQGRIQTEERPWISVDWAKAPAGTYRVPVYIDGPHNRKVVVYAVTDNPLSPRQDSVAGFVESDGYVSIEAEHYSRAVSSSSVTWQRIPNFGRTLSGMTIFPVTASPQSPEKGGPRLEYRIYLFGKDSVKVQAYLSPTLNFHNTEGLRYAVSFDEEQPQVINMHARTGEKIWEESVSNNITICGSKHLLRMPGEHLLKFWAIDPGVVLQKIVVDTGGVKPSYLGPPESFHRLVGEGEKSGNAASVPGE